MNRLFFMIQGAVALFLSLPHFINAQGIPLPNAFAHNDYQHKQPLFEAIKTGYANVEADVYVYKGKLVVTHVLPQIHHKRTLEALYLAPLANYFASQNGEIPTGFMPQFTLMIDIKSDPDKAYRLLKPLLEKYRPYLSGYQNGQWQQGAVRIVLSGNKPYHQLKNDQDRLAFIDQDLRKIKRDTTANLFNMASCKLSKLVHCKKDGTFSKVDEVRLRNYVEEAHRFGARVRLWSSPDKHTTWRQLLDCGVDLIGTDKLGRLRDFLVQHTTSNTGSDDEDDWL